MVSHLEDALKAQESAKGEITKTLKQYPTDPVEFVRCLGRVLEHINALEAAQREAYEIAKANNRVRNET